MKFPGFGGEGLINVQVELFENGDILLCYGEGGDTDTGGFSAGVEDFSYLKHLITDPPFGDEVIWISWNRF